MKRFTVSSPMCGRVFPLAQSNDPSFYSGSMGIGCAILPEYSTIYSPICGVIEGYSDNHCAVLIESRCGIDVYVQVGCDTEYLHGGIFHPLSKVGKAVEVGEPLISFDMQLLCESDCSLLSPVVIPSKRIRSAVFLTSYTKVGSPLFVV